ncbi:hypothetical protein C1H46_022685 [Malus baccata]|uniref:Uncharacterized protein n=1 Tax=Malus baccata TaxID=106549 RepID=A0A540LYZ3_MALBA|nr:hypothetical protein C1H46_022685 [Malus baccata]
MSLIVHALSQFGIRLSDIRPLSTSEPFQPEHAQNSASSTSKPVLNPEAFLSQSFQLHENDELDSREGSGKSLPRLVRKGNLSHPPLIFEFTKAFVSRPEQ